MNNRIWQRDVNCNSICGNRIVLVVDMFSLCIVMTLLEEEFKN